MPGQGRPATHQPPLGLCPSKTTDGATDTPRRVPRRYCCTAPCSTALLLHRAVLHGATDTPRRVARRYCHSTPCRTSPLSSRAVIPSPKVGGRSQAHISATLPTPASTVFPKLCFHSCDPTASGPHSPLFPTTPYFPQPPVSHSRGCPVPSPTTEAARQTFRTSSAVPTTVARHGPHARRDVR
jgi:hypothetical protein